MAPPRSRLPCSRVLHAVLLGSSWLSLPITAKLDISGLDHLVQVAFSPNSCHLHPQCLTWWSVEEPWNVATADCRGRALQHWLLPQDGQGVLRPAAYPDLCLEAYRREGRLVHYPANANQTMFRTLALTVTKCSGHPSQSFIFSLPGQVGRICSAEDNSMCFGGNYKCMPDTHLHSEVMLAPEEVLRACGQCTKFGTMEVVFPFSMDSPFESRRLDLAIYNSIIWVLLAVQVVYLAGLCLRARQALMETPLSGVPSAGKLALRLWNRLRSAWCSRGVAPDRVKAIMDTLRTHRVLAIVNVVVHLIAQLLLWKTLQFGTIQESDVSVETVNLGFIRDSVSYSELPECLFLFISILPFWLHPRWVCARTINGFHISVALFQALLVVRRAGDRLDSDCGLSHRISSILLRTVSSVVFAQPSLSAFLNVTISALEVFVESWSNDFTPSEFTTYTREFWITSLIVCTAWAQESSMRAQAAALLEAKEATCSKNAVSSLLHGFCDAVVHLDQDIQITDGGKLHGLLLLSSSKSWQSVPFTNLVRSEDVPRVIRHLKMSREALNSTAPPIGYPISIAMQDMNRTTVNIELHCTCVRGVDDQICYVLGLKEAMETMLPCPPASSTFPTDLEARDDQLGGGSRSTSTENESLESRAADCASESDAEKGDTLRIVAFKPDTFEIVEATMGFEHLAGRAARRAYLIDYIDRPGEFAEMLRNLVDGVASGRLSSAQSFRSQRPLVFKFTGREQKVQATLAISFRSPDSQAAESSLGSQVAETLAVARLLDVKPLRERRSQGSGSSRRSPRSGRGQQEGLSVPEWKHQGEEEPLASRRRLENPGARRGDVQGEEESLASRQRLESPGARRGDVQAQTEHEGRRRERSRSWEHHGEISAAGPSPGREVALETPMVAPSVLGRHLQL